ncbi:MAG: 50S ribosomal protein L23 [Candidatus Methanoperedenaceae archaeon]|jgi:large subunit ribosomal protein L23|nr:50S ribosomal protein L23 [Candidatus Methanoperedens sp.]PWB52569.1 MAG: 50S ribosomal protein L23 [Candidatus Methanoperedenaceae archaeon]
MIQHPYITEKATMMAENNNVLQFIVDINDSRTNVKREIEALFKVKVASVNMMMTSKGKKKAIVSFQDPDTATELASRLGIF